jgi:hypothetical protein
MTLVLGRLLVQGVRFTAPLLEVEVTTGWGFLDIWPPADTFPWPTAGVADDATLDQMNEAQTFITQIKGVRLSPFKPANRTPGQHGQRRPGTPAALLREARGVLPGGIGAGDTAPDRTRHIDPVMRAQPSNRNRTCRHGPTERRLHAPPAEVSDDAW